MTSNIPAVPETHDACPFQHPGGQEAHLRVAGKDASECFDEVGHSEEAESLMRKFRIGVIRDGAVSCRQHRAKTVERRAAPKRSVVQGNSPQYVNYFQLSEFKIISATLLNVLVRKSCSTRRHFDVNLSKRL